MPGQSHQPGDQTVGASQSSKEWLSHNKGGRIRDGQLGLVGPPGLGVSNPRNPHRLPAVQHLMGSKGFLQALYQIASIRMEIKTL